MPDETIYYDLDHSGAEIDSAVAFVEANEYKDGTVTFDADTPAAADNLVSGSRFGKIFADLRKWYSTFLRKVTGGILGTNASIYSLGGANARIMFPKIQIGTGPSDAGVDVERVDRKVSTMPAAPTNDQYPSALLLKSTLAGYVPTTRKVNNKPLSADVSLTANDVGAIPVVQNYRASNFTMFDESGKIADSGFDSGDFVQVESDPTVPAWAKETNKPTYTPSEIGAVPASQKGVANGVATLDENAKVPSVQLADDKLPATPDDGEYEVDVPVSFVSVPKSAPAPTSDAHLVNKAYADTKVALVDLGTDQDNGWYYSPLLNQAIENGKLYSLTDTDGFKVIVLAVGSNYMKAQYAFDGEHNCLYSRFTADLADNAVLSWGLWTEAEQTSNKVPSISESSTDEQYPSAKCVYDAINSAITGAIEGEY
jgi:hypothetical protein